MSIVLCFLLSSTTVHLPCRCRGLDALCLFENFLQLPYFFVNLAFQVLGLPVYFQVRIVSNVLIEGAFAGPYLQSR